MTDTEVVAERSKFYSAEKLRKIEETKKIIH